MEKDRKYYQKLLKVEKDYKLMTINFLQSFLGGGIISFIGQVVFTIYYKILSFDLDNSRLFMTLTIILLSGILTGFGIYDKLGQIFKCGFAIPISGEASRGDTHFLISIYKYMYIKDCKNIGRIRCKSEKINSKVVFFAIIEQNWGEILKKADETPYELKSI